jgi:hypothetical protein
MFDLTCERGLSLAEAAKLIPPSRGGKRTHLSTILRWILHGAKGPQGSVVRLEAVRLGGRWLTTCEAIHRFTERLTPSVDPASTSGTPQTPGQQQRAAERAARELDQLGI